MTSSAISAPILHAKGLIIALAALCCAIVAMTLAPSPAEAAFGLESVNGSLSESGAPVTQAGAHPDFTADIKLSTTTRNGVLQPEGNVKDIHTALPPGLIGNPQAFQRCTQGELRGQTGLEAECPVDSQIGVAEVSNCVFGSCNPTVVPIYNMYAPSGVPGQFGFNIVSVLVFVNARVHRISGDGGYALATDTEGISQTLALSEVKITLWGVPADPVHNPQRYYTSGELKGQSGAPASAAEVPLMRNPTSCSPSLSIGVQADSWAEPGVISSASFTQQEGSNALLQSTGCERTPFAPSLSVQPTSTQAGAPTGLQVALEVPQNENPHGLAGADLRRASVTLPPGMVVNPSAADGLGACGVAEIDLAGENRPSCPASSEIGEVKIVTPLLSAPLEGEIYQARQGENPFSSTLALYLVASGSGVVIKLPGKLSPDPLTGQLTATFSEAPQLPFSMLSLRFKGGVRAPLSNPTSCGTKTAGAQLESWGGSTDTASSSFIINGQCSSGGFNPSFDAGSTSPVAGAGTAFTLTFSRTDGEQTLGSLAAQLPPGLLGLIKNVPLCAEPQAAQGACSEASRIGTTTVAAGAGSNPFYLTGKVYLTGPYGGAPYGLSVVVPALAGPLNLGLVVVRASIHIDPNDAHLSIATAALPTILQGIPLQLKLINVDIDRPAFMFNPTSCAMHAVTATLNGGEGASAPVATPFRLTGCAALPFKAKLTAFTRARASNANGAYLQVKISSQAGEANIAKVKVALPKQLPSRLSTLHKACLASTFDVNPSSCPAASVVGHAQAATPVLRNALTGPAYLVSHGGAAFPDLEIVLQGEGITIVLDGKTNISHGITSSSFDTVPDAPISSFDLILGQGPHSVLGAYGSLCSHPLTMPTTLTGQNGDIENQNTRIAASGCPRHKVAAKRNKSSARKHG